MNKTPLISIIIPTYNRAYIIEKALNSILAQTYKNWECIIVDDGSTDNTSETIQLFLEKDARFQYYERPNDVQKGPSGCRNYGYEKSIGEYIQWFDSDDLMHPEKIKVKLEFALKNGADVIVDNHSESDEFHQIDTIQADCFTSEDFYINFILGKRPVITNDVMLKRAIIKDDRFDENLWKGEEFEFYGRIFQQKLVYCFLDVALTCYRISPDSISISPKQTESLIYLSKKLQAAHTSNSLILERAKYQGRKTYRNLAKRADLKMILKHFNFFRKMHHKSVAVFALFVAYNILFGSGFDRIKPKELN
ncbi:MAG: hypothetical protein CMC13_06965 [Flavobacteriaceae bacterium]|nr:hypothetical protein [Flavobacteriaceae bacterium]|tara:strand:- start:8818 stop:9738 length:921 start_codon:yes stop_codon:yes gene_type:complete